MHQLPSPPNASVWYGVSDMQTFTLHYVTLTSWTYAISARPIIAQETVARGHETYIRACRASVVETDLTRRENSLRTEV